MSLQAMIWAFRTPIANVGAKFVLLALAEHAREDVANGWSCFPSVERLTEFTAQSERTVERHLAWLAQAGWIVRRNRRSRGGSGGAYTYTLQPDNVSDQGSGFTRHIDGEDPTETPVPSDILTAPYKKEPAKKPTIKPHGADGDFETWWAEYPLKVEKLGAEAAYRRIISQALASADELLAGAMRYAAEVQQRDRRMVKHPTRWLSLGCWTDGAAKPRLRLVETVSAGENSFEGPRPLWEAAVALKGVPWALSWLAPCRWEHDGGLLLARTELAASRIVQELRATLRSFGVQIGVAAPPADSETRAAPNDLCASKGVVSTPSLRSGAGAHL